VGISRTATTGVGSFTAGISGYLVQLRGRLGLPAALARLVLVNVVISKPVYEVAVTYLCVSEYGALPPRRLSSHD